MSDIKIVHRKLTSEEVEQVNAGFDNLSIEEGIALERTERISCVALSGNDLIGSSFGLAHKNGENYSGWFYLTDLFVEKEFRNQGIGTELLIELEKRIRIVGVKHIYLWTSGSASVRFYKRHGYSKFAKMENWYSDGSNRVGLRKTISLH